jgi:hypothetical protein
MSWRCSIRYWYVGPLDLHTFVHALDSSVRWTFIGIGRRQVQVWPLRQRFDVFEARLLRPKKGRG